MKPIFAILLLATASSSAAVLSYSYDAAGRLTGVNYNGTSNTAYAYDKNGNLLARLNTTNPLPPLAANYTGLITNAVPSTSNSGLISLKLAPTGVFTGKVFLFGKPYSFGGTFAADGTTAPITITRKAPLGSLTLNLTLDVAGGTRQVTGTISDGTFTSAVALDRASFDKKSNPLPGGLVGKYTALFQPTEATSGIPQGHGFATLTVDIGGNLRARGALADGSKISQGAIIAGQAVWPLFVPLYKNNGYLAGEVTFASDPGTSDFSGEVQWLKAATSGPLHPAAFTTLLDFIGSKYGAPGKGQRALDFAESAPNATFTATGGNLASSPLTLDITLTAKNTFLTPSASTKLKLALSSGLISGSFTDGGVRKLGGVLFQEQNAAAGFFGGSTESGAFTIEAKP